MTRIPVVQIEGNSRWTWTFYYHSTYHALWLVGFTYETRPTPRHKFRVEEEEWDLYRRGQFGRQPRPDVIPDAVLEAARTRFLTTLRVGLWPDNPDAPEGQ